MKKDVPVRPGSITSFRGQKQIDGTQTSQFSPPDKGQGLASRPPVPARSSDSGLDSAMQNLADTTHRTK